MLLREFLVDNHTINLTQAGDIYITTIINSGGEKVFHHEYEDYEKIKLCFDEIIQHIENGNANIQKVLSILEKSCL